MEINKNELQNLLDSWMDYREEELTCLTEEDKEYFPRFEEGIEQILQNVIPNRRNFANNKLEEMYDSIMDYSAYWDRKYYKNGFADGIKLILSVLM